MFLKFWSLIYIDMNLYEYTDMNFKNIIILYFNQKSCLKNYYLMYLNPLNAELNPIRHLLALVGARHFVHVSRVRVNIWLWMGSYTETNICNILAFRVLENFK